MNSEDMPLESQGKTIRALIVDDEEPGRINLRYALAAHGGWQVAGECGSVAAARAALAVSNIEVVFLDIQMPRESGLELARSLCVRAEPPLVIFVTAFNAYAVEAFEVHALDYLLKPFTDQRLAQALLRAEQLLAANQRGAYGRALGAYVHAAEQAKTGAQARYWQQLTVRSVGKIECIRLDEVFWIGAAGNYVELHTANRTIMHRLPLNTLEAHLDPQAFVRVHRGALVRADQFFRLAVISDGKYLLSLRCGEEVAVSERHVQAVRACMQEDTGESLSGTG